MLKTFILTKKIVLINYYSWLQKKSERFGFERRKSTLKVRFLALWQICIFRIHHWRKSTTELTHTYLYFHTYLCFVKKCQIRLLFFLFRKDYFCQYYPAMWPWRWKQTLQASQWTNSSTKFTYRNMKMSGKILHSDTQNLQWKLRHKSAICWNSLGLFRDNSLNYIFFRNKTFLSFKIESWNFQHLFVREFRDTSNSWRLLPQFSEKVLSDT